MISPKNFFLFTPLLPSVAVGTLSPRSIIQREHRTRPFAALLVDHGVSSHPHHHPAQNSPS